MSTLRWNPVYGRLEFELPEGWQSDITVIMSGPYVKRAIIEYENVANQADSTTTVEKVWSSCDGENGATKLPPDGGYTTLRGRSLMDNTKSPPELLRTRLCWIIPLHTEGSMCIHPHNLPTTQFIAPDEEMFEGTSPTLWHSAVRFETPEGDTVEIIVVAKDERGGGGDNRQRQWPRSEYTRQLVRAVRKAGGQHRTVNTTALTPQEAQPAGEPAMTPVGSGVPGNGDGRS